MTVSSSRSITKRTRLTIAQQIVIAGLLQRGHTAHHAIKEYSISRQTVTNIITKTKSLFQRVNRFQMSLNKKNLRIPSFFPIKQKVIHFVSVARSAKMPVILAIMRQKAGLIRDHLVDIANNSVEKEHYASFAASKG